MNAHQETIRQLSRHHLAVLLRRILLGCAAAAFIGGLVILASRPTSILAAYAGVLLVFLAPLLVFIDLMGIGTFFEETEPDAFSPEPDQAQPRRDVSGGVWSYGVRH